jgi:hypothetical protein
MISFSHNYCDRIQCSVQGTDSAAIAVLNSTAIVTFCPRIFCVRVT